MRMSSTATSGFARAAASTASTPVGRLGDDAHVGLAVDDLAQAAAHERLVVGQQDADAHRASGSRARTA